MKTLVLTGAPQVAFATAVDSLAKVGLNPPTDLASGGIKGLNQWHEAIVPANKIKPVKRLSRAWEMAASQLYLANIHNELWGWGDYRSTWLLDFWASFDDAICFLMVYISPEETVRRSILEGATDEKSIATTLVQWKAYTEEMLRFSQSRPERCLWVSELDFATDEQAVHASVSKRFSIKPSAAAFPAHKIQAKENATVHHAIELWLSSYLASKDDEIKCLAAAVAHHLPSLGGENGRHEKGLLSGALHQLRSFYEKNATMESVIRRYSESNVQLLARAEQQAADNVSLQEIINQMRSDASVEKGRQLKLADDYAACQRQNSELLQTTCHLHARIAEIENQHSQHISKLQAEYESTKSDAQLSDARNTELLRDLAQTSDELQNLRHENAFLVSQTHTAQYELADTSEHLADLIRANASMVRDLERTRILMGGAELVSFEKITLEKPNQWVVAGFNTSTCAHDKIAVRVKKERKGFIVAVQAIDAITDVVWDESNESVLNVNVCSKTFAPQSPTPTSTASHRFLTGVCSALSSEHTTDIPDQIRDLFASLRSHLLAERTLRYDAIALKREERQGDYEHLWLELKNASFGSKYWENFQFRLAAARVSNFGFSSLPRLEFPAGESRPRQLEGWFAESEDNIGAKYELRFDTAATAIDIAAWNALSASDRLLVKSILDVLPNVIRAANTIAELQRPVDEWVWLASSVKHTFDKLAETGALDLTQVEELK